LACAPAIAAEQAKALLIFTRFSLLYLFFYRIAPASRQTTARPTRVLMGAQPLETPS